MKLAVLRGAGLALAIAATASTAVAQSSGAGSDQSGPGGAGAGTAALGFGVPASTAGTGRTASSGSGQFDAVTLGNIAGMFAGTGSTGTPVANPASGTTVIVPQTIAQGLGAVLNGQGTGPGATALLNGLTANGAIPSETAGALVQALATLGGSPSHSNLVAAVMAYNAAVGAMTGAVPSSLLAVRAALGGMF